MFSILFFLFAGATYYFLINTLSHCCVFVVDALSPDDIFLIACAQYPTANNSVCSKIWEEHVPSLYDVQFSSTRGPFTVHVVTAWAPIFAARFWILSRLNYFEVYIILYYYSITKNIKPFQFIFWARVNGLGEGAKKWLFFHIFFLKN